MQAAYCRSLQREDWAAPLVAIMEEFAKGLGWWFPYKKKRKTAAAKGEGGRLRIWKEKKASAGRSWSGKNRKRENGCGWGPREWRAEEEKSEKEERKSRAADEGKSWKN